MEFSSPAPRARAIAALVALTECTPSDSATGTDSETTAGSGSDTAALLSCQADLVAPGFAIDGAKAFDYAHGVPCGDINGDGLDDILLATTRSTAYVVFGKSDDAPIALTDLSADQGFVITVEPAIAYDDLYVAPAGDLNGDGFADLVAAHAGELRLLAGGPDSQPRVIQSGASLPPVLTDINSPYASVSPAGDVNGDGFDDLLVDRGEPYFSTHHVLLGDNTPGYHSPDDLAADIGGVALVAYGGIEPAGDVNGDGFDDLAVISAPGPFSNGFGGVEVVFGGPALHSLTFAAPWPTFDGISLRVDGFALGYTFDIGQDIDGDGRVDLVLGVEAPGAPRWVLFGHALTDTLLLPQDLTEGSGFSILADAEPDAVLWPRLLPDLDGDGRAEIEVHGDLDTYVIRGKADSAPIDLDLIAAGIGGYIHSDRPWASQPDTYALRWSDIDGLPGPDAIISAPEAQVGDRLKAGCTYIYFAPEGR